MLRQTPANGFFQQTANIAQLRHDEATPPLILRLRPSVAITTNAALTRELQNREILERVEAIIQAALTALPEDSEQREIFLEWRERFRQNPLRTAQQRYNAAVDLEWLLYEQIETQSCLRIAIDERSVDLVSQSLLGSSKKVTELRTQYRAKAKQLLHAEITQHTLDIYREFIDDLFYEMRLTASQQLTQERETVVLEKRKMVDVCRDASTSIHETCMQSKNAVESHREEVVQQYNDAQAIEHTRQTTLNTLERIMRGNNP